MKKFIIFAVCFFIGCIGVSALENDSQVEYQYIGNVYSNRQIGDNFYTGPQGFVYVNSKLAYCLDPTIILRNNIYSSSEDFSILNIDQNKLAYLELVSYFGYGYNGRNDANYYLATQEIIWEYLTNGEIYWTNGKGGEVINIDAYKNDIFKSINNYLLKPDLPSYVETYQGQDVTLDDKNGVLKYYVPDSWLGEITDNTLKLDATFKGTAILTLNKKPLNHETSYIYLSDNSQALATFGYSGKQIDSIDIMFKVKILSKLTLVKKDSSNASIIKNKETKIKIYDVTREKYIVENGSDIFTIGSTGILTTETFLEEGTYRIEEITAPAGYKKLTQPFTFNIRIYDSSVKEVSIFNEPISYSIQITKKGEKYIGFKEDENGISGQYIEEYMNNVVYGIYAKENILDSGGNILYEKDSLVTKSNIQNGIGTVNNLTYGKYYIKELECPKNYVLDKTITEVDFTTSENNISLNFLNKLKKGDIIIRKMDNQIGLRDAEFNLKGTKYSYSINLKSNNFGYVIVKNLPYDTYYLEETTAPLGYLLDNEIKELNLSSSNLQYDFINIKESINKIPETETPKEEENSDEEEKPKYEEPNEEEDKKSEIDINEEEKPELKSDEETSKSELEEPLEPEEDSKKEENNHNDLLEEKNDGIEYSDTVVENPKTAVPSYNSNFVNVLLYIGIGIFFGIHKYIKIS